MTEFRHLLVLFSSGIFPLMTSLHVLFLLASERNSCMLKCHLKEGSSAILASGFCSQDTAFTLLNIIYK